jgi:hypothetical protein
MNQRFFHFIFAVAALVAIGVGCESTNSNQLRVATFVQAAKKPRGSVKVFQTTNEVNQPYKVIALLTTSADAADEAAVLTDMLNHAADLGGDGLLLSAGQNGKKDSNTGSGETAVRLLWGLAKWDRQIKQGNWRLYRAEVIALTP